MSINIENEIGMKVKGVLGKGSFATVYYCINSQSSKQFAVKIFHKQDFTRHRLQSFRKQAQILSSIEHKNIVKFNSFKETQTSLYLIMEYIAGGTLKQLISDRFDQKQKFTDSEISLIIKSILEGIQYLHKFNIIHRDLKPENILVADPGYLGSIKIVDFGLSAQIEAGSPKNVKSQCGTLLYMAPEILHQPSYSKAVDIWSCAIIMYILFTGKHPIYVDGMKSEQFKQKLKSCSFPKLPDALGDNFIKNLSKIEYTQRYSVNEALRHPWITRNEDDQIPLSVNQSIHSFNTTHLITDMLKFVLTIGHIAKKDVSSISEEYREKVRNFNDKNEQSRVRSPSHKKYRRQNNEKLSKLKQLITNKQKEMVQQYKDQYAEVQSPLLAKHQKLFLRLFEKQKIQQQISQTLILEQCRQEPKLEVHQQFCSGQTISVTQQIPPSPILINCSSFTSSRNNALTSYDMELPLIKINPDKKDKGLRKLNSLREESSKHEQNLSYFKNWNSKISEQKTKERETLVSSKSKRASYKFDHLNFQYPSAKNPLKKPQTAQRGKATSKSKQITRPMIFGIRGTHS